MTAPHVEQRILRWPEPNIAQSIRDIRYLTYRVTDGVEDVKDSGIRSHRTRLSGRVQMICMQRPHSLHPAKRHHKFGAMNRGEHPLVQRHVTRMAIKIRSTLSKQEVFTASLVFVSSLTGFATVSKEPCISIASSAG